MAGLTYRCPNTGLRVQGFAADDAAENASKSYVVVSCVERGRSHLVNPKTGKGLGPDK
jgi:hypothetical protein